MRKAIINDETYGKIKYEEDFWAGKRSMSINGNYLSQVKKNVFEYKSANGIENVKIVGDYFFGVNAVIGSKRILLFRMHWYEFLMALLIVVFTTVWGNLPFLYNILPIVNGLLGTIGNCIGFLVAIKVMSHVSSVKGKIWSALIVLAVMMLIGFINIKIFMAVFDR